MEDSEVEKECREEGHEVANAPQSETGWIFEAGDLEELEKVLIEALSDPERLKSMGLRARDHIANYSYERATDALLKVLHETR